MRKCFLHWNERGRLHLAHGYFGSEEDRSAGGVGDGAAGNYPCGGFGHAVPSLALLNLVCPRIGIADFHFEPITNSGQNPNCDCSGSCASLGGPLRRRNQVLASTTNRHFTEAANLCHW